VETLFQELKSYVSFDEKDEAALRALKPIVEPEFARIADVFYERILAHEGARTALEGGESQVGRLKQTLRSWMDKLFSGPWDEDYFELRCRIGRVHVRIALPQHYMLGAMNLMRQELYRIIDRGHAEDPKAQERARTAVGKILDLELAIMLHTYREDLQANQNRIERLATFGQLVGSIAHELRNPLGVIESSLYLLKSRIGSDERANKHIGRISEQLGLANSILTSLLDMIRERPLVREDVDLHQLFAEAVSVLKVPPGVSVRLEAEPQHSFISGDRTQLGQVLRNLLDNALHAVGATGSIVVSCQPRAKHLEISVSDTGSGVDPTVRKRLFEPLISAKPGGIGLGLALVKRIVERHSGTIAYVPKEQGARFVLCLPIGATHG
jgi:signal transduction histidine kinase